MELTTTLALALALLFAALGSAKVAAVPSMRARAAHVGFTPGDYRRIGVLELLGATGLVLGVAVPALGVLSAVCLVLLLVGAVVTHLRNGDGLGEVAPALAFGFLLIGYVALGALS